MVWYRQFGLHFATPFEDGSKWWSHLSTSFCNVYISFKSHRLPYSLWSYIAIQSLKLLHLDLWGPSPFSSHDGYHYYVSLVDVYSWFCWLLPLKSNSDFFLVFKNFVNLVEQLFGYFVKKFKASLVASSLDLLFYNFLQIKEYEGDYLAPTHPIKMGW